MDFQVIIFLSLYSLISLIIEKNFDQNFFDYREHYSLCFHLYEIFTFNGIAQFNFLIIYFHLLACAM